jgi:tetratricopeptide (TPR) repeat protein
MYTIGNRSIFFTGAAYFALCSIFAVPVAGFPQMPFDAVAYYNRGMAYYFENQYERAVMDYNQAIKLKPNFAEAYSSRGIIYAKKSAFDLAMADYTRAIKLKPDLAEAYVHRASATSKKAASIAPSPIMTWPSSSSAISPSHTKIVWRF